MERYSGATGGKVVVELSSAEALVLFELLERWSESGADSVVIEHQAEQRVLRDIGAALERTLPEPLRPDYLDVLAQARRAVVDES